MKSIALIDDTQINLTLLWHLVKRLEYYEPVSFLSPLEGLDWCMNNDPELIIVDFMMPDLNGIEFIKKIRASPNKADTPILMVTANDNSNVRYEALESGATDFLNKPIDKTEFMIRVRNMLSLRSSQRKLADKAAWLADEVQKATREIRNREQEVIFRLSKAAEYRDPETGGHIRRMAHYSKHIANQLETAQRYAFYLLKQPKEFLTKIATDIVSLKKNLKICSTCLAVAKPDPCPLCSDPARDASTLCVIATQPEMLAIETTKKYNGLFSFGPELAPANRRQRRNIQHCQAGNSP